MLLTDFGDMEEVKNGQKIEADYKRTENLSALWIFSYGFYWHWTSRFNNLQHIRSAFWYLSIATTQRLSPKNSIHTTWLKSQMGQSSHFSKVGGKIDGKNRNIVWFDDLVIHSQTHEQHLNTLELVMQ